MSTVITETSMKSISELQFYIANAIGYLACPWVELSMLLLSMLAGFAVSKLAAKSNYAPCSTVPCAEPSPSKHTNGIVGGRIAFQREPPAVQEASILLQQGKVKAAVNLLQELPETLAGSVPTGAARSVLIAAMRNPKQCAMMSDLEPLKGKIAAGPLEALLTSAADKKEVTDCRQLDMLSRFLQIPKSQLALEALAKTYSSDANSLRELVEEAATPLARPFAEIVLQACSATKNFQLAANVFEKVCESDAAYLRSVVKMATAPSAGVLAEPGSPSKPSPRSTSAGSDTISDSSSPRSSSSLENQLSTASSKEPEESTGLKASVGSYHDLMNARVMAGDQKGAWRVVTDMQMNGVSPDATTCSILLKCMPESIEKVGRVLVLTDAIAEPMDDVFFKTLTETCLRLGSLDILSKQIDKCLRHNNSASLSAQTYGSMIKAQGLARDVKRAWALWNKMLSHKVPLTSVTLASMVEALVTNGLPADAWHLVKDLEKHENVQPLLDNVIYSMILKGFSDARQTEKAMTLYEEMKARNIQPNAATFNAILSMFAQSGTMQHVPAILADMKAATPPVDPDIVTHTTLIKGFCNSGNLDRAVFLLKNMRAEEKCSPNSAIYNCLLSSCAKESRPDEALQLLSDMRKSKIAPASTTLSALIKLVARRGRLDEAFTILEDTRNAYDLRINIDVYTALIQGCFQNGQAGKALALYDNLLRDGEPLPDALTYTVLVRGCVRLGLTEKATHLVRCAHGIGMSSGAAPGLTPGCVDEVVIALGGADSEQGRALLAEVAN